MRKTLNRPVDLARLAGVSAQQIRNYLDAGVLPLAARSEAGYRQLDDQHRRALLAYRALAEGHGWTAAGDIMRAIHADDRTQALALIDADHADLHRQREALKLTAEALETVVDTDPPARAAMQIGELAAHLGVRTSTLRVWEAAELLAPQRDPATGYRTYGPKETRDARIILMLRQGMHRLPQIRPILDDLRRTGSRDALRAAIAQRHGELGRRAEKMLAAAALLHAYLAGE
ncbi:MerR family transcriptional regulator [Kutzneria sp. CA-103260]|uniref:MerR family transcriptional regulator n=1 Tax=Kutzneria sp. CA-103260 TaxID=2802641 RepID=UPI001BAA85E0|nr:MerR family transcriptional regulator [Kutzneria sp. CA-103260]QUQ63411.1 MerR family transcriptional regulator [Kutzneria sp. CA-103260]